MAESNVNIMLDTVRKNRVNIIYAVENDYGARFITATIMTDGKKKAVEKTAVVTINAERPDGQRKAFEGSVNEDGTVKVPVTQWMLEFEGEVVCSVSVVTSTSRLTTTHFYIQAQYSVWDGTSAPSADDPDKDVIVSIIAAENERVANENARISAENTRKTAETARIDAENTRIANEASRVSSEAERVSAESVRKTEFATWQGEMGKISAFDKRIENLEAAVTPGLVTPTVDDSVAYQKNVPTGALPNAMISEIGGMTRKCENLWNEVWEIGFIEISTGNNAPSTARIRSKNFIPCEGETVYSITRDSSNCIMYCYDINKKFLGIKYFDHQKTTTLANSSYMRFMLDGDYGVEYKNDIAVYKGEVKPYQPYFTGLRDAKVTAVESVGITPFHPKDAIGSRGTEVVKDGRNCIKYTTGAVHKYIPMIFKENTRYSVMFESCSVKQDSDASSADWVFAFFYTDGTFDFIGNPADGVWRKRTLTSSAGKTVLAVGIQVYEYKIDNYIDVDTFTFVEGTVLPDEYKPYFKNTFPIPEAVQALDGYGQGVNAKYCNKIVLDSASGVKKYVKSVGMVDMGTLDWAKSGTNNIYFVRLSDAVYYGSSIVGNALCAKYTTESSTRNDKSLLFGSPFIGDGTSSVVVHDDDYIDAATFKEAMSGVMLVYELAIPVETDLSDYFGDDNFIGVEAGGTITAVNEYEYDVPSVIEYTVKGSDAV